MTIKNTDKSYGMIAKWLHWLTALLFLLSYICVYYRRWFTEEKTSENWTVLQLHLSIGVTIGVIFILRIVWKTINKTPQFESGTRLAHLAIHIGHYSLYAMIIIMVLTGYFGTGANVDYFSLFEITKFENTAVFKWLGLPFDELEKPMDYIHKTILGSWLVWMLILGHVLAALYHTYIKKDQTLYKMMKGNNR